jgi:predicted permease
VLVSVFKLIIYPLLVFVGLHVLGRSGTALAVPVLILASPTAVVSFIMAKEMRGDAELAAAIVIGTTTLSLLTYLGWLILLGQ